MIRLLPLLLAAALAGGCGEVAGQGGTATVWVTRDEGAHVLVVSEVPAGLTAMQALDRVADVETRYGGRFVEAIDGLEGSLSSRRDWFYFVNGYEADRSASEYTLRDGDVEWWDYRSWAKRQRAPVVVGAFPEPFLHGYGGVRRPALVVYTRAEDAAPAGKLARVLGGQARRMRGGSPDLPENVNVLWLGTGGREAFSATFVAGSAAGDPVVFMLQGGARALAADPGRFRYRYEVGR
ncbi:MAG: DUF4430 domain-containing protein [Actinobacteria bacterium]|nr:DUF4430 domain-containing protein [Actinomycetota bacterium]